MKKIIPIFLLLTGLFFACTSDKAEGIIIGSFITFEIQPDEQATLEKVRTTLKQTTSDRDDNGYLKKENFPFLISQLLGVIHKNPSNNATQILCLEVAEVLKIGRDYERAAKLYLKTSQLLPKNETAGKAIFQLAYMQEQNMNNKEAAIINYTYFLRNYPNHPFNGIGSKRLEDLTKN